MDFSGVLNTILTITTIIAGALAGLQRGVVQNFKDGNTELRARVNGLVTEKAELEKENAALLAEAAATKADLAALGRVITGEAHLTAIGDQLNEHHARAEVKWEALTDLGREILAELKHIKGNQ